VTIMDTGRSRLVTSGLVRPQHADEPRGSCLRAGLSACWCRRGDGVAACAQRGRCGLPSATASDPIPRPAVPLLRLEGGWGRPGPGTSRLLQRRIQNRTPRQVRSAGKRSSQWVRGEPGMAQESPQQKVGKAGILAFKDKFAAWRKTRSCCLLELRRATVRPMRRAGHRHAPRWRPVRRDRAAA